MPQRLQLLVAVASLVAGPNVAAAQGRVLPLGAVALNASAGAGAISGTVRDEAGQAIAGASVVAMGVALVSAQSDDLGRFSLALQPGAYVLRASRQGYISTFREPVQIQTSVNLERNITLIREGQAEAVLLASMSGRQAGEPDPLDPRRVDDHPHTAMAWRLRHLARSILRDSSPAAGAVERRGGARDFRPQGSLLDRAVQGSAKMASTFFSRTDFTGQVNFLTTGSLVESAGWRPAQWSRGVAYAVLGAPVGAYGDWSVRGAVDAGDLSSWVLLGEYRANSDLTHAFNVGMSLSVQGDRMTSVLRQAVAGSRSVGAVFGYDRWLVRPGLDLEYGLRIDRYDYAAEPNAISPRVGARIAVLPRTHVAVRASQHVVAPGANEFLPPTSSGPWLPPERTFSPLEPGAPFQAERVRHVEVSLEYDLDDRQLTSMSVRRFRQFSHDQIATLFGPNTVDTGHYTVATPGHVEVDGWGLRLSSALGPRLETAVQYAVGVATWDTRGDLTQLRLLAPSAIRATSERMHDLRVTVDADVPETDTRVAVAYRLNSAFGRDGRLESEPGLGGRFSIEVRQGLPYEPLGGSRLELLLAVRNLFHDAHQEGSFFDELLTIAPPLRLMGGVRVRF